MKIETKDMQKVLDWLKKNAGDPSFIEISLDFKHQLRITSYTDAAGQVRITVYDAESALMPDITRTERL